ncbi:MAG: DUF1924 domain-containing protein [Usitatibacter sp.]
MLAALAAPCSHAADDGVIAALLKTYEGQGGSKFAAAKAEVMWTQPFIDVKSGDKRRCSACHSDDLRRQGKHVVTGKLIDPLAASANPKRLTDPEHIEKWFLRNCKWTLGRECSPQEKGDFLVMIRSK